MRASSPSLSLSVRVCVCVLRNIYCRNNHNNDINLTDSLQYIENTWLTKRVKNMLLFTTNTPLLKKLAL